MTESLLLVAILTGLVIAVLTSLRTSGGSQARALARLEAKVDGLLKHAGIRFDPYAEVPPPVIDALRRGKKIEAIREYRVATGAGLKEAKEYIDEVARRVAPGPR